MIHLLLISRKSYRKAKYSNTLTVTDIISNLINFNANERDNVLMIEIIRKTADDITKEHTQKYSSIFKLQNQYILMKV